MCLLRVYDKGEKQGIFGEKMLQYAWKQGFSPSNYTYVRETLLLYTKGSRLSWMHAQFSLTFVGITSSEDGSTILSPYVH